MGSVPAAGQSVTDGVQGFDDLALAASARLRGRQLYGYERGGCRTARWSPAIERGQATLATINGMPFTEADPIHTCVRTQFHGLRFPRADTRAEFSLTIDLSKDPR